jgi:hypothetical protein
LSNDRDDLAAITAYLRVLGNPYAKLQVLDVEEVSEPQADPDLRPATAEERAYARLLQNQYALLSITVADSRKTASAVPDHPTASPGRTELSKRDFVVGSTRVLRPYIPSVEKGRLRRHHRDFIIRNQNRTPSERYLLLRALSKYDLGSAGIEARFNREREDVTDEKLKQIERSVFNKKSK